MFEKGNQINKGRKQSATERKARSDGLKRYLSTHPHWSKGRKLSDEHKAKLKGKVSGMKGKHHTESAKEKNRLAHLGKPAWNKGKHYKQVSGEKCHLWRGGVSKVNRKERENIMSSLEYKNWRRKVFERDKFTCVMCGARGITLNADHIKRFTDYPKLRFRVSNG